LAGSPIFQYLLEVRNEFNRILIVKPDGVQTDILRGKIIIIDEILNMAEAIRNSERLEREHRKDLDRIEREIQ